MTMVEPLSALLITMSVLLFDIASLSFLVKLSCLLWVSLRSVSSVFSSVFSFSMMVSRAPFCVTPGLYFDFGSKGCPFLVCREKCIVILVF